MSIVLVFPAQLPGDDRGEEDLRAALNTKHENGAKVSDIEVGDRVFISQSKRNKYKHGIRERTIRCG